MCAGAFTHLPRLQKGKLLLLSYMHFPSSVSRRLLPQDSPCLPEGAACHVTIISPQYPVSSSTWAGHRRGLWQCCWPPAAGPAGLAAGRQFCRAPSCRQEALLSCSTNGFYVKLNSHDKCSTCVLTLPTTPRASKKGFPRQKLHRNIGMWPWVAAIYPRGCGSEYVRGPFSIIFVLLNYILP